MPRSRYSAVAIVLHWAIAGLILANIAIGWRMGHAEGLSRFEAFQLHKSIGILVLLLSLVRLGWRLTHAAPALPAGMGNAQRLAAKATHGILYGFMIGLPLTGWATVSASPLNLPTLLFGTLPWPHIGFVHDPPLPERKPLADGIGALHMWLAWSLAALLVLHVAAALKHHWVDRDDVLARMLPGLRRRAPVEET